ncbi:MAG: FtsX-like permease family protein [Terriglobales bacterium]
MVSFISELLRLLWAGAALILLIACANLVVLGLARGMALIPALRVRVALGARPRDLLRSLLSETVILAAAGCALGFALAVPAVRLLQIRLGAPDFMPAIDLRLLAFTVGLGVFTVLLIGCWPAWLAARGAVTSSAGRFTAPNAQRSRSVLVTAEVALALVLAAAAGLIGRSFYALAHTDPGFNPDGVLTAQLSLPQSIPLARRAAVFRAFLDRIRALPGVAGAGAGAEQPWGGILDTASLDGSVMAAISAITPGYFRVLQVALLRGRLFTPQDTVHSAQVAIINQRLLQKLRAANSSFPANPIGASITWAGNKPWRIVGVVGDVVLPSQPPDGRAYFHETQVPDFSALYIELRAKRGDPMVLLPALRKQLAATNPDLALGSPQPLAANRANWAAQPEAATEVAGLFGVLALLLAATGLYGLTAYAFRQRERELGVRMALGAQRTDIYKLILSTALLLTSIGLLLGGAGLYLIRGALASQLYGLGPLDPLTLAAAVTVFAVVALAASIWPARRAVRADPMRTLRTE